MVWLEEAKKVVAGFIPKDGRMRILTTAYKDKTVFLECSITDNTGTYNKVWVITFDSYGKLNAVRSYND